MTMNVSQRHFLHPPWEDHDDTVEVGVVTFHPCFNRIAYSTRTRTDESHDLYNTEVVVHDFDETTDARFVPESNGRVVCSFDLQELTNSMNESPLLLDKPESTYPNEIRSSSSSSTSSSLSAVLPVTVKSLGAVQSLAFLDREALLSTAAHGFVREKHHEKVPSQQSKKGDDNSPFLMLGFKRCIVIISVFKLKHQIEGHARGISVSAYIGPKDLDENDSSRRMNRQPSSFAVPVSEHILAYGCCDGTVRFYDLLAKRQAKCLLGPNGRNDPVVRVVNANPNKSPKGFHHKTEYKRKHKSQPIRPRIVTVCASGNAFIWELDLLLDPSNGKVIRFVIPPPLARINGIATVTGVKRIPVEILSTYPSYDRLDAMNSMFEVSYDPCRNILFWMFSSNCIKAATKAFDPRGVFALWSLAKLPVPHFPPNTIAPLTVIELPHTASGEVSADMIFPGYLNDAFPNSSLITTSGSPSGDIILASADLAKSSDFPRINATTIHEANVLFGADKSSRFRPRLHAIAVSRFQPSTIAVGTRGGVIILRITNPEHPPSGGKKAFETSQDSLKSLFEQNGNRLLADSRSEHCEDCPIDIDTCNSQAEKIELKKREGVDQSLEEDIKENELAVEKVKSLEAELEGQRLQLQNEKEQYSQKLLQEKVTNEGANKRLDETMEKIELLRHKLRSNCQSCERMRVENEELRRQLEENAKISSERIKDESCKDESSENGKVKTLEQQLNTSMEKESFLRNYIKLLEEDKSLMDQELDLAKMKEEDSKELSAELQEVIAEQKISLDLFAEKLDNEQKENAKTLADQERQLKMYSPTSVVSFDETSTKNKMANLEAENANIKEEALQASHIFLAMQVELQNAMNEVAEYRLRESAVRFTCEKGVL